MRTPANEFDTERLSFRLFTEADYEESASMWGQKSVVRFIGGKPFTREEVWTKILRAIGHWDVRGYGYWAVRDKATRSYVGEVGFADFHRIMEPSIQGTPEAGWVLAPEAHGKGFATEAVRGAHAWLEGKFGPQKTVCLIDPDHRASIHVAEKCGYVEYARTMYHGDDVVLFERGP